MNNIVKIKETGLRESMKNRNLLLIAFKGTHFPSDILPDGLFYLMYNRSPDTLMGIICKI